MNNLFFYRLAIITGQVALMIVNVFWPLWSPVNVILWLACVGYFSTLIFVQIGLKNQSDEVHQKSSFLLLDLLMWGLFFYFLNGVSNPLIWCLLIPSVLSALSQQVSFTWLLTLLANVTYLLLWWLTPAESIHAGHGDSMQQHITGMWLGFIAVSFLLTWATTTLMQRLDAKNESIINFEKQQQADQNIMKMATLATSLAHELGTPLASIKLLVEELKHGLSSPQQIQDLEVLDSQVMRCKAVLAELTAVTEKSHLDDAKLQPVIEFINEIVQASTSVHGVLKVIENQAGKVLIRVDSLLHLACLNVLNNAVSAGAEKITIILSDETTHVRISITDDGAGKAHRNADGLGIGLELTTRIVKSIGGSLSFNRGESGARCLLDIPSVKGGGHA